MVYEALTCLLAGVSHQDIQVALFFRELVLRDVGNGAFGLVIQSPHIRHNQQESFGFALVPSHWCQLQKKIPIIISPYNLTI